MDNSTQNFALDVAYKSDVEHYVQANLHHPIAMAYGFVLLNPSGNQEIGEKVDLKIDPGDTVVFSFFDIADSASKVSNIEINCTNLTNPGEDGSSLFGWRGGTLTIPSPVVFSTKKEPSGGCNVKGYAYSTSSYTAQSGAAGNTYDLTITLTLDTKRVFQVDPEMDVMESAPEDED